MLVNVYSILKSAGYRWEIPGSLNEGYGLVANPTETNVVSGLSCNFASQ
jgi:hypothetical protein